MIGGGVREADAVGVALGVTVRVGVMDGGGAGSQIMGVVVGGRVVVGGGGAGSQIMGVAVGGLGVVGGGGAGSQTGGAKRHAVLVPPKTMTMARMAFCKSLGSLVQGIMIFLQHVCLNSGVYPLCHLFPPRLHLRLDCHIK